MSPNAFHWHAIYRNIFENTNNKLKRKKTNMPIIEVTFNDSTALECTQHKYKPGIKTIIVNFYTSYQSTMRLKISHTSNLS